MMVGIAAAASAVQPDDRAIRVKTKANSMLTRDDGGRARTRTRGGDDPPCMQLRSDMSQECRLVSMHGLLRLLRLLIRAQLIR
jgi:hypothetical protein